MSEPKSSGLKTVCVCVCPCFRFICIYPVYINSKKTLAEGRRIPSEKVRRVRLNLTLKMVTGLLSCSTNKWNVFINALLCVFLCAGCWEPLLLRDQRCPHCCWSQCLGGGKNLSRDHRLTNVLLWLWTEKLWLPVKEWCSCCTLELLHECVVFKHTYVYRAGIRLQECTCWKLSEVFTQILLQQCKIRSFQNKMHPREWNRDVQFRGRVRVQLKQTDGSFCQDKFSSRE